MADARYRIFETKQFLSDLKRLAPPICLKIQEKLSEYVYPQLRQEPHAGPNVEKLKDWKPETWRYRIGPWRFFYEIHEMERIVYLTALSHRRESYR